MNGASSYTQFWRFSDESILVRFSPNGITSKELFTKQAASVPQLTANLVNQITVGMTLAQVQSILGTAAYSSTISYDSSGMISGQTSYWYSSSGQVNVYFDANSTVKSQPGFMVNVQAPTMRIADIQAAYQALSIGMTYSQASTALASHKLGVRSCVLPFTRAKGKT